MPVNNFNEINKLIKSIDVYVTKQLIKNKSWEQIKTLFLSDESLVKIAKQFDTSHQNLLIKQNKIVERFQRENIYNTDSIKLEILSWCLEEKKLLSLADIPNLAHLYMSYKFYNYFISRLIPDLPLLDVNTNLYSKANKELLSKLFDQCISPYSLKFDMSTMTVDYMLKVIRSTLLSGKFMINEVKGHYYLNKRKYPIKTIIKWLILNSNQPISTRELITQFNEQLFLPELKNGLVHSRLKGEGRDIPTILKNENSVFLIDESVWANDEHLHFNSQERKLLLSECKKQIMNKSQSIHSGDLYKKIKNNFPYIRSKYELSRYLSQSEEWTTLGYDHFVLKKYSSQKKRVRIGSLIINILSKEKRPLSYKLLFEKILKKRKMNYGSLPSLLKSNHEVNIYPGSYVGLLKNRDRDTQLLSDNLSYAEDFLFKIKGYVTDEKSILKFLEQHGLNSKLIDNLFQSSMIKTVDEKEGVFFLHDKWPPLKKTIVWLENTGKSMQMNDLIEIPELKLYNLSKKNLKGKKMALKNHQNIYFAEEYFSFKHS